MRKRIISTGISAVMIGGVLLTACGGNRRFHHLLQADQRKQALLLKQTAPFRQKKGIRLENMIHLLK